MDKVRASVA
ncbi:hypothetical protein CP8484711_0596, partial [Chlamydia psittaci 84-8471/1]